MKQFVILLVFLLAYTPANKEHDYRDIRQLTESSEHYAAEGFLLEDIADPGLGPKGRGSSTQVDSLSLAIFFTSLPPTITALGKSGF